MENGEREWSHFHLDYPRIGLAALLLSTFMLDLLRVAA